MPLPPFVHVTPRSSSPGRPAAPHVAPSVEGVARQRLDHVLPRSSGTDSRVPDGIFAEWEWDGRRMTVRGDRYAFRPLFYWCDATQFVASPSLALVAQRAGLRTPDVEAIAVFLHLGYYVNEDTPLRGVRTLPPTARLTWDGTLTIETSRSLGIAQRVSRTEAMDGYIDLFRAAIARRPPTGERCAVPLSGGRDSRHILLELVRQGFRPTECITSRELPPRGNVDVAPAAELCARLGLNHVVVSPPRRFEAETRRTWRTSYCCDEHEWMLGMADRMAGRSNDPAASGFSTSWDGIAGDTLSAPRLQKPEHLRLLQQGKFEALADELLGRDATPLMSVLPERFRCADARAVLPVRLARHLEAVSGGPNPLAMSNIYSRSRREIAMMSTAMLAGVPTVYCPFLDHELFDYLAGLPEEIRYDPGFHDDVIARAYPEIADVPYAPKNVTVRSAAHFARFGAEVMLHLLSRNPSWLQLLPRTVWQWATHGLSRDRRARERWLSPSRLLYFAQLAALLDDCDHELAMLAREPGIDVVGGWATE